VNLFFISSTFLQNGNPLILKSFSTHISSTSSLKYNKISYKKRKISSSQGLVGAKALLGPSGGFFGVGSSEVLVIGVVAWLILGPKRLYQLARDVGRISAEFKNVTDEARLTFQKAVDTEIPEPKKEENPIELKKQRTSNGSSESRLAALNTMIDSEISNIKKD
jgi:Sec-independent protein translocase protein TatA